MRRPTLTTCLLAPVFLWLGLGLIAPVPAPATGFAQATVAHAAPTTGDDVRHARARKRLEHNQPATERQDRAHRPEGPAIADNAPPIDPHLVDEFASYTATLASDAFGGRQPATPGGELAAGFIETHLAAIGGLRPAFTDDAGQPTWRQAVPVKSTEDHSALTIASDALDHPERGTDYELVHLSGSGEAAGPLVFVGYSIAADKHGYLNYAPTTDLTGKVALVLRFEPMDDRGRSRWQRDGWSYMSSLPAKVSAAARRGAAAVVVVTPPGARGEERDTLPKDETTPGLGHFEIPVVFVTRAVADALVRAGDPDGRTLADLRALADEAGVVIDLPGVRLDIHAENQPEEQTAPNIGAVLPGRGALADQYVVVGAHYDRLGMGHFASRSPDHAGQIHPGADDNASGTAAVMLAAEQMAGWYAGLDEGVEARSVLFLLFTAEESGLVGSRYYVQHPIVPIAYHAAMLNMDMVGRLGEHGLELGGMRSSRLLTQLARERLDASGIAYFEDGSIGQGRSDHASFDAAGVPNLFAFTGLHDDYHTYRDTADKLNNEGGARIARTIAMIALDAALAPASLRDGEDPVYAAEPEPEPTGPKVRVGIVPEADGDRGVRLLRVFDNTSAADAGLQPGDHIVSWNGQPVTDTASLNRLILEHEPGDIVTLGVVREDAPEGTEPEQVRMRLRSIDE